MKGILNWPKQIAIFILFDFVSFHFRFCLFWYCFIFYWNPELCWLLNTNNFIVFDKYNYNLASKILSSLPVLGFSSSSLWKHYTWCKQTSSWNNFTFLYCIKKNTIMNVFKLLFSPCTSADSHGFPRWSKII